jgi:hypothetical protein
MYECVHSEGGSQHRIPMILTLRRFLYSHFLITFDIIIIMDRKIFSTILVIKEKKRRYISMMTCLRHFSHVAVLAERVLGVLGAAS